MNAARLIPILTWSGAIPFIGLTWWLLRNQPSDPKLMQALTFYGAAILAFLGGANWGRQLAAPTARQLILAVGIALLAWVALLLPWVPGLVVLILGLLGVLVLDWRDATLPQSYRRLRLGVTTVVTAHLAIAAIFIPNPNSSSEVTAVELNVLGTPLHVCGLQPRTGFYRNGLCVTGLEDRGTHSVCAVVTAEFLDFTLQQGNDLITPRPDYNFPGLRPGDRWCLCASRWEEARLAGVAPPVILEATHQATLAIVRYEHLVKFAWPHFRGSLNAH